MKAGMFYSLLIFLFFSSTVFSQAQKNSKKLVCSVKNGSFIVINQDGDIKKKFIEANVNSVYKCEKNIAAALIGNHFVVSNGNSIQSKRLFTDVVHMEENLIVGESVAGSYQNSHLVTSDGLNFAHYAFPLKFAFKEAIHLEAKKNLLGGMIGNVFVVSDGSNIRRRTLSLRVSRSSSPQISSHTDIVSVLWESYFIASNGDDLTFRQNVDASNEDNKIVSAEGISAASVGGVFFISNGNSVFTRALNDSRDEFQLEGDKKVVMAYIAPYLVALDRNHFGFNRFFVNNGLGTISIRSEIAVYITNDFIYRYNPKDGRFKRINFLIKP